MFPGILLFYRRGKKMIFCIIVDHRLGQDLVVLISLCGGELFVHKGSDLIHVKIDVRYFFRSDIINVGQTVKNAVQYIICIYFHIIITPIWSLYSNKNQMTSVCSTFFKIFPDKFCHSSGEQEQRDQVRDGHQTVEGLRHAPEQSEVCRCADDGDERVDDHERTVDPGSEEKLDAARPVKSPSKDRGKGKAAECHRSENGNPVSVSVCKSGDRQLCSRIDAIVDRNPAAEDDQGGHGTDDDGVHEHLEDSEEALLDRGICVSGGVGDGTCSQPGFVGEDPSCNSFLHAQEKASDHASRDGGGSEGSFEDGGKYSGDVLYVQHDDSQSQDHIEKGHERHEHLCNSPDPLDTAQKDHGDQHRDDDPDDQAGGRHRGRTDHMEIEERRIDGGGDGIDLCGVPRAEYGEHAEQGKYISHPAPFRSESVFDIVPGTADPVAVFVFLSEMYRERYLGKFGAHSEKSGNPHPEDRARTADGDGACYAGDISGAHGRRKRGTDRLEGRDGSLGCLFFMEERSEGHLESISEFLELNEARAEAEQQSHTDDADHGRNTPDKSVDSAVDLFDCFQHKIDSFLLLLLLFRLSR